MIFSEDPTKVNNPSPESSSQYLVWSIPISLMKLNNKECEMRFCMFMLSVSDRKVSSETRCGSYCFRGIMVIPVLIHKYRLYKCACFIIAQKIIRNSGDENQFIMRETLLVSSFISWSLLKLPLRNNFLCFMVS